MKYLAALLVALLILCRAGAEEPSRELQVEVVRLAHRRAAGISPLLQALKSPADSIAVDAEQNQIIIRDGVVQVADIRALIAQLDVEIREENVRVRVQVITAAMAEGRGRDSEAVKALKVKLDATLKFKSYTLEADMVVTARAKSPVTLQSGAVRSVGFTPFLETGDCPVKLDGFQITADTSAGKFQFHTDLNLPLGEPVLVGGTTIGDADHAVILVLTAEK